MPRNTLVMNTASLTLAILIASSLARASSSTPTGPLIVDANSHVVVVEYEAWFGPNAATFQGTAAKPLLQSADMQAMGGGYDSADPQVIQQHVAWMEYIGIDAAISEVTNNVSCIFNTIWFARKYLPNCTSAFRSYNQTIRDNTGNLYPAWTKLGTNLKLIPLLGGIDEDVLYKDLDGKTAFEKEVDYFGSLMQQYPDRQVIYEGKPLMLIFLGAAQDPSRSDNPLWFQIRKVPEQSSRDRPEIYLPHDGGISRQPALSLAEPGQGRRPSGDQSGIRLLELDRPPQSILHPPLLPVLSFL